MRGPDLNDAHHNTLAFFSTIGILHAFNLGIIMSFLLNYASFLLNTATIVIAIIVILSAIFALSSRGRAANKTKIRIKKLNTQYNKLCNDLQTELLTKKQVKLEQKKAKKNRKNKRVKRRIFVLKFKGDIQASQVESLRDEITAILTVANSKDEVLVCLESPGGVVHGYGLAASQLQRIKARHIKLTIAVDKVAASGGYMMACVADKIIAAPFAIIGSIGVVLQMPNFNKLLNKNNIEFEQLTAGDYKRTLTMFGENTEKARKKMQQELEETHKLFKNFIKKNRPSVHIDKVATGEHWFATQGLELQLVDQIKTSDDYLLNASKNANVYQINKVVKKSLSQKLAKGGEQAYEALMSKLWREKQEKYYS